MSLDKTLARIIELISVDKELHDAIVELLEAKTRAENELANFRKNRIRKRK